MKLEVVGLTGGLIVGLVVLALAASTPAEAKDKSGHRESLEQYIQRVQPQVAPGPSTTPGGLWIDNGRLANLAQDYKGHQVGDLVTILVVQDVTAQNSGDVSTDRSFKAGSGIDAIAGHVSTSGVQNIFSGHSSATLTGKSAATTTSKLRTSLAGQVVAVLPSGAMVVEADRQITMNNERQTIVLRGLVRPGDLAPDNSVLSNNISNLELELKGKGVLSDGTRPPNVVTRVLLKLIGF